MLGRDTPDIRIVEDIIVGRWGSYPFSNERNSFEISYAVRSVVALSTIGLLSMLGR